MIAPSAAKLVVRLMIRASVVVLLSVLIGCQASPPPLPPPVRPPPPAARIEPSAPKPVGARWSFTVTETACIAHASNPAVSLTVRVGDNQAVLSVMASAMKSSTVGANTHARLLFRGPQGSWTLPARTDSHHVVMASLQLNDTAVNNVLVLLGGGRLETDVAKVMVPALRIPDSDVSGREWFDCVHKAIAYDLLSGSETMMTIAADKKRHIEYQDENRMWDTELSDGTADSGARQPVIPTRTGHRASDRSQPPPEGWRSSPWAVVNRRHALRMQPRATACQPKDCRCVRSDRPPAQAGSFTDRKP